MISDGPEIYVDVKREDAYTKIQADLKKGPANLRAQFLSSTENFYTSAYYVYVKKVEGGP